MSHPDEHEQAAVRALEQGGADPVVFQEPPAEVWLRVQEEALGAGVVLTRRRRPGALVAALVAATVGVLAGIGIGVAVGRHGSGPSHPASHRLASGTLAPLPGQRATGSIGLYEQTGHQRVVRVHVTHASAGGGFVEAWLLEPGTTKMIALGIMTRSTQTFAVPADVDLGSYRAVDISAEPLDGDPAHSTDSLARGELQR